MWRLKAISARRRQDAAFQATIHDKKIEDNSAPELAELSEEAKTSMQTSRASTLEQIRERAERRRR